MVGDFSSAFRAYNARGGPMAAGFVQQVDWGCRQAGPFVAPLHDGDVDGEEGVSLGGEAIFLPGGPRGVGRAHEDALVDEQVESVCEYVSCQADPTLKLFEAPCPVEGLPQYRPHPSLAEHRRRSCDGAVLFAEFLVPHAVSV